MFLRKTSRFKDGKRHDYWSVAENARAGARVVQRQLLYLGEIDEDRQNAWLNAIDEPEERKAEDAASYLIPPQPEPKRETSTSVRIRLSKMTVENIREWGACWLGLCLWDLVGLDEFWTSRLLPSSHGTDWLAVFKAIVLYRLTDPGSEWRMHREWYDRTAVRDLLGNGAFTPKSTLYSCLDRLVAHKDGMFEFLRHGYSRDRRGDCLQVVIALVLTPDGLPLAYEVMPGNTSDKGTQVQFVERLVKKYGRGGKLDSLWLMDRGVPAEETLSDMRDKGFRYLVGSPRSMVDALGKKLDSRIEAHIFVSYAAYCLQATLKNLTRSKAGGLTPRQIFDKMKKIYMVDVKIPTTDGREIVMQRYGEPKDDVALVLSQLGLRLPAPPPPKIDGKTIEEATL